MNENSKKDMKKGTVDSILNDIGVVLTIAAAIALSDNNETGCSNESRIGRDRLDRKHPTINGDDRCFCVGGTALGNAMCRVGCVAIGESKRLDSDTFFYISENSEIFGMSFTKFRNRYHIGVAHIKRYNTIWSKYEMDVYDLTGKLMVNIKIDPNDNDETYCLSRTAKTAFAKSCETNGYDTGDVVIDR